MKVIIKRRAGNKQKGNLDIQEEEIVESSEAPTTVKTSNHAVVKKLSLEDIDEFISKIENFARR